MDFTDAANHVFSLLKENTWLAFVVFFTRLLFQYDKVYNLFSFFTEYKLRKLRHYGEEYLSIEDNENDSIEKKFIKKEKKELLIKLLTGMPNNDKSKIYMYLKFYGPKNSRGLKKFVDHIYKNEGKWVLKKTKYKIWRFVFKIIGRIFLIGMCCCFYFWVANIFRNKNDIMAVALLPALLVLEFLWLNFEIKLPNKKRAVEYERIIDKINIIK